MEGPEFLEVFVPDQLVDSIVRFGAEEGGSSVEHDEDYDSCSKDISLDAQCSFPTPFLEACIPLCQLWISS